MGTPAQVDGRYSFWYEYGTHGERIQVAHNARELKDAMKHADGYAFDEIDLTRSTFTVHGTRQLTVNTCLVNCELTYSNRLV